MVRRSALSSFLSSLLLPLTPAQAIIRECPTTASTRSSVSCSSTCPTRSTRTFNDPGDWFTCTGTLVNGTIVVTAGHCTFAVGLDGEPSTAGGGTGSGGNDVWINFHEEPDFTILPRSSTFGPDENPARYAAWSAALNASPDWHRATAFPHPQYDADAFFLHDLGILRLQAPVAMPEYGEVASLGLLDQLYEADKQQLYTPVGYGLEKSGPHTSEGGDTRMRATTKLDNLNGVYGTGKGIQARFSGNAGKPHRGGTCFGDSGGPIFRAGHAHLRRRDVVRHQRHVRGRDRRLPHRPGRRPGLPRHVRGHSLRR